MDFISLLEVGLPLIFSIFVSTIFYLIFLKKYRRILIYLAITLLASGVIGGILAMLISRSFHTDIWIGEGGLFGAVITSLYFMVFIALAVIFSSLFVVSKTKKEIASEGKTIKRSWLLIFFSLYFLVMMLDHFRMEWNVFFTELESRQLVINSKKIIRLANELPIMPLFLCLVTCIGLLKFKDWARYLAAYQGVVKVYYFVIFNFRLYVDNDWFMKSGLIGGMVRSIPSIIAISMIYYLFHKSVVPSFKEKSS